MAKISANVLEAVGNTPLVRLNRVTEGIVATVCAKLEASNPGRSVKDRIGLAVIEDAERKGLPLMRRDGARVARRATVQAGRTRRRRRFWRSRVAAG